MVIIPREKPVIENLNIYYLNVKKLLEHYQGEIGSGGIYFKAHAAEGVIYFDQNELLNGIFRAKDTEIAGRAAINRLVENGDDYNFSVNIYKIGLEEVYFWASIPSAEKIYKDLSTEFTDLEGLIKKMSSEKLTGYIDVSIGDDKESGLIFIINGKIMGGSFSWSNGEPSPTKENQDLLIRKTKELGGTFNVCRIPLSDMRTVNALEPASDENCGTVLDMLEEFLGLFESVFTYKNKIRTDFNKLLKKKFIDNAEKYAFLDPFAGEFEYFDRKIHFNGDAGDTALATGVIESVKELAQELGLLPKFVEQLAAWSNKYSQELTAFGIEI